IMLDVLISGAAGSDLIAARGRDMLMGNFEAKGPVWLAIKDLGLALESAKRLGVVLPMAGLYQQLLLNAHYSGWDQRDATVVMTIYEQLAGIKRKAKQGTESQRELG
ncbi:MAG: NAD-binding protein, partial [Candidatus Methylomirabilia bacterium]